MNHTATSSAAPRVRAVDWMRGLTMAAMILVNNPGSWVHMLSGLAHASFGAVPAPADFVFPFFLFVVGVSVPLALRRRRAAGIGRRPLLLRATRRAALLVAIGLFLNLFPDFDLATVRLPGVLQRIAVVYWICAAGVLLTGPRGVAGLIGGLLVVYTLLLLLMPVPGVGEAVVTAETSLPVWVDERVFGDHSWRGPGDPEGLLSTLGAAVNGLAGVLAGWLLLGTAAARRKTRILAVRGVGVLLTGLAASFVVPVAKEIWTASYALITTGVALLALALLHREFDGDPDRRERPTGWEARVIELLGRQALLAYVVAHLLSDLSIAVIRLPVGESGSTSLHAVVYRNLFSSWLPGGVASLGYSLLFLAVVTLVVALLDRRGIRLRV